MHFLSCFSTDDEDEFALEVKCHFWQASVNKEILSIGDCVYVKVSQSSLDCPSSWNISSGFIVWRVFQVCCYAW